MRIRPLTRTTAALVAAMALVGLMGLPASANTRSVTMGGGLTVHDGNLDPLFYFSLDPGAHHDCSPPAGTATAVDTAPLNDGAGTFEAVMSWDAVTDIFMNGTWVRLELDVEIPTSSAFNTYVGSGAGVSLGYVEAAVRIRSVGSSTSCTPTGPIDCAILIGNLGLEGSTFASILPTLDATITLLDGHNTFGDDLASGSCGPLVAANDGAVDLVVDLDAS